MSTALVYLRIAIWVPWVTIEESMTQALLLLIGVLFGWLLDWLGRQLIRFCFNTVKKLYHLLARSQAEIPQEQPAITEGTSLSSPSLARERLEAREPEDTKEKPETLATLEASGSANTPKTSDTPEAPIVSETPEQPGGTNRQMPLKRESRTGLSRREVNERAHVTRKETT